MIKCAFCDHEGKMITRHVRTVHGMDPEEYKSLGHELVCTTTRSKMSARMTEENLQSWQSTDYRERRSRLVSEQMKKQWEDPDFREKMSEVSKRNWMNPEFREKMTNLSRERLKSLLRELWEIPEYRERMSQGSPKRFSKPHRIVSQMLSELGVDHINEHYVDGCSVDIWIPSSLKVIEVNGVAFHGKHDQDPSTMTDWQFEGYLRDMKRLDLFGEDRILFVWEDELDNPDEVRKRLRDFMGIN